MANEKVLLVGAGASRSLAAALLRLANMQVVEAPLASTELQSAMEFSHKQRGAKTPFKQAERRHEQLARAKLRRR